MKNLNSLIIVLCVLIVLGCKCESNMLGLGETTPTPSTTPSSTPTPGSNVSNNRNGSSEDRDSSEDRGDSENRNGRSDSDENERLATGTYTGKGINTTKNQRGDFLLRIDSVNNVGSVKGYFEASNGLRGTATVTGTVDKKGKLSLSGTLDDGQSLAIAGTVSGDTISAGYGLADTKLRTQQGNFTVTRR